MGRPEFCEALGLFSEEYRPACGATFLHVQISADVLTCVPRWALSSVEPASKEEFSEFLNRNRKCLRCLSVGIEDDFNPLLAGGAQLCPCQPPFGLFSACLVGTRVVSQIGDSHHESRADTTCHCHTCTSLVP